MLVEFLPQYLAGEISPIPQDDNLATYAPMLKKSDGKLDFEGSAEQLARQIRAYHPWPGTFTYWKDKPLKIHKARSVLGKVGDPGSTTIYNDLPAIYTANGLLVLEELQPAGKKRMGGAAFLSGARDWGKR